MPSQRDVEIQNYPTGTVGSIASNGTTEVAVIAAPGSGKRLRLLSLAVGTTAAGIVAGTITLRNGISGATFYQFTHGQSVVSPTYAERTIYFGEKGFALGANQALMASGPSTDSTALIYSASARVESLF